MLEHLLPGGPHPPAPKLPSCTLSHAAVSMHLRTAVARRPVHGILQARTLEWVARPSSRDLADPGIEPGSLALQADSLPSEPLGKLKVRGKRSTLARAEAGRQALQPIGRGPAGRFVTSPTKSTLALLPAQPAETRSPRIPQSNVSK